MFSLNKPTDQEIIERIKQGDEKVLLYLYKQHFSMVKSFVLKNNGDESFVNDVLQDAVIAVWRNVHKESFILTSKLSTYIMGIAKNLWFKELKKRTRFKLVDETNHLNAGSEEIKHSLDQSIIVEMIAELDETCKKLLTFFYFDGYNNTLIAEKLGMANANTVKSKKYQCFKKLQSRVTEQYKKEDLL